MRERGLGPNAAGRHRPLLRAQRTKTSIHHELRVLRVFQSQPLLLQCLLFFGLLHSSLFFFFSSFFYRGFSASLLSHSCAFLRTSFSECWIANFTISVSLLNLFRRIFIHSTAVTQKCCTWKTNDNLYQNGQTHITYLESKTKNFAQFFFFFFLISKLH